ncbi:MAG: hypothetical protein ACKO1M_13615 [Planctomycetota bacterium]
MSPIRNLFRPLTSRLASRAQSARRSHDRRRLGAEPLEQRLLLAADIAQVFSSAMSTDYTVGARIPIQVLYSEPVTVSGGSIVARVANGSVGGGSAAFKGVSAGGLILNFDYTVAAGDNVAQFDVLLDPTDFIVGGVIRSISDSTPADRRVGTADVTLADVNAGLAIDTTAPVVPTIATTYVNPLAYSTSPTWAALHSNYFVIRGTAGTTALPAGETLSVLVNGATYRPTVNSSGEWAIRIRPLGNVPASVPVSGSLQPWSTTNGDAYDVVATIADTAGNRSSDSSTSEVVMDRDPPEAAGYFANPSQASYRAGQTISIYVQYDEPVRVVGTPTLSLNVTPGPAVAAYDPVATAAWTAGDRIYFSYTALPGDSAKPLNATGLNLNGGAIEDLAANPPADPTAIGTGALGGITIDTTVPTLVTPFVSSTSPDGTYVVGSPNITITVKFSEPVFVTGGVPELALNAGAGAKATYSSGTGTDTLSFTYTVLAGQRTPALDYTSTTALSLNGAAILDAAGNAATLTLPGPTSGNSLTPTKSFVIVATPTVIQVSTPLLKGTYTAGQTIPIWVMFTEVIDVRPGPSPTLLLNTNPASSAAVWTGNWIDATGASVTTPTNILQFEYLVQPGDTTTGAFLNYASVSAIQSAAGIGHAWTGPASPQFLAANTTLPAVGSSQDLLPFQITIAPDTVAPPRPGIVLTDTGYFSTDRVTNIGTLTVVNIEPRATWEYSYDAGVTWNPGTGTSFVLPHGSYAAGDLSVRQTDWSGNVGAERRAQPLVVDIVLPNPPTVSFNDTGVPGDGITRDGTVTVGGLDASPPTGSIRYSIDSGTSWTVLFPGVTSFVLPAGTYAAGSVLVAQQDLAGNISPAPFQSVAVTTIMIDTSVVTPVIALEADTGVSGSDRVTNDPTVLVSSIENGATWQYSLNGGTSWTSGSGSSFDLPNGVFAAGQVVVRQTDLVGNTAAASNTQQWVVDLINPVIAGIAAPAGTYLAGSVIPITVTFSEVVFHAGASAPTLTLSTGRVATLAGTVPTAGTMTMTFNYTVQVNDSSPALQVTSFNTATGTSVGDRAGNLLTLNALANPVILPGPVVVNANIRAFSPIYGSDPAAPLAVNTAVTRIPIQFTTPVRNFQLASIRLFWNGRSVSLKGAQLVGSGSAYTLYVPRTSTNLRGIYQLEIAGPRTTIQAIAGGFAMTGTSNIYWRRA